MTLKEAQKICMEIDGKHSRARLHGAVKWTDVFKTEDEIVEALGKVFIPKNRNDVPSAGIVPLFTGYEYIYSFAYYVQQGWTLSEKQMRQCKRLATEILKAAEIGEYKF